MPVDNYSPDRIATLLAWGIPEAQIADDSAQPENRIVFANCKSSSGKEELAAHLDEMRAQWQHEILIYIPKDKKEVLEAVLGKALKPDPDPYITPEELSRRLIAFVSIKLGDKRSETDDPPTISDIAIALNIQEEQVKKVILQGARLEMNIYAQYASNNHLTTNDLVSELLRIANFDALQEELQALCGNQTPDYPSRENARRSLDISTLCAEKEQSLKSLLMRALNNCCHEASACRDKGDKAGAQEAKIAFDALLEMTSAVGIEGHALEQLTRKINSSSQRLE